MEHRARKRFGQNFLADPHYVKRIVDAVDPQPGDNLVEIGPGLAALTGELIAVSGADPLNLVGVLLPGAKVPALTGNRVLYRDGAPVAALIGGDIQWFERLEGSDTVTAETMLIQRRIGSPLLAYLR